MKGASSFVCNDRHLRYCSTSTMLNHTEFLFKGLGLGMKLFDKCFTLKESPKLPILSINNSTTAIIISKTVMHYIRKRWTFDPFEVHHVAWWSEEGHIDAWKCWRNQYLRPQPRTDVIAFIVVDLPGHYINFGFIRRITPINVGENTSQGTVNCTINHIEGNKVTALIWKYPTYSSEFIMAFLNEIWIPFLSNYDMKTRV